MTISSRYKELLRTPTTADKLSLFQFLFDTKELTTDLSLALLKIIHKELANRQTREHYVYRRYAETIESLHFHMADTLQQVINAWNNDRSNAPAEWFLNDNLTAADK